MYVCMDECINKFMYVDAAILSASALSDYLMLVHIWLCRCMYVCMYVWMDECIHKSMYVDAAICECVCMYVWMNVSINLCM